MSLTPTPHASPVSPTWRFSGSSAAAHDPATMTPLTVRGRPTRALLLAGMLLALFAGLGLVAHQARSGTALDHMVLNVMLTHRSPTMTTWALIITTVFSPVGTGVLAVFAGAVMWWRSGSPRPALVVLGTLAGAGAASTLTKLIVGAHRPRAGVKLIAETEVAFPAGHDTGTLGLLGRRAFVVGQRSDRTARALLAALAALAGVAVGFTRLYLGVHWVSDVVGGLLLGAAAVVLAQLAVQRMVDPVSAAGTSATQTAVPTNAS